jgi:RimJ/RimL family protein N-acetyltransferase
VALGPLRRDLIPVYVRWMNDPLVTRGLGARTGPYTEAMEEAWYAKASEGKDPGFLIYRKDTWQPIGTTALHDIDHVHGIAEFGINIGERDAWDQGFGTETARLMLDYGFNVLNLVNIQLRVFAFNPRVIRSYEKAGFKVIGQRRQAAFLAGRRYDIIYMDCLASEFESPLLRGLLLHD